MKNSSVQQVYKELMNTTKGKRLNQYRVVSHGDGLYSVSDSRSGKVVLVKAESEYEAMEGVL